LRIYKSDVQYTLHNETVRLNLLSGTDDEIKSRIKIYILHTYRFRTRPPTQSTSSYSLTFPLTESCQQAVWTFHQNILQSKSHNLHRYFFAITHSLVLYSPTAPFKGIFLLMCFSVHADLESLLIA
jgi:hypothetical protein